jgi:hypothetical protein
MNNRLIYIVGILLFALSFISCGDSKKDVEEGKSISQTPKQVAIDEDDISGKDKVFYGMGKVRGIQNKALARSTASNRARAEIVKISATYLAILINGYMNSMNDDERIVTDEAQHVGETLKSLNRAAMSGVEILKYSFDSNNGVWYALASLEIDEFLNNLNNMQNIQPQLIDYINKNALQVYAQLEKENPDQIAMIRKIFKDVKL